jgi:hypothetical protein
MNAKYNIVRVGGKSFYKHRIVWELENGPIPIGHVVHHIDGNKRNNALANLELVERGKHVSHHGKERRDADPAAFSAMMRDRASKQKKVAVVCVTCGNEYIGTKSSRGNKFCSVKCRNKARKWS